MWEGRPPYSSNVNTINYLQPLAVFTCNGAYDYDQKTLDKTINRSSFTQKNQKMSKVKKSPAKAQTLNRKSSQSLMVKKKNPSKSPIKAQQSKPKSNRSSDVQTKVKKRFDWDFWLDYEAFIGLLLGLFKLSLDSSWNTWAFIGLLLGLLSFHWTFAWTVELSLDHWTFAWTVELSLDFRLDFHWTLPGAFIGLLLGLAWTEDFCTGRGAMCAEDAQVTLD